MSTELSREELDALARCAAYTLLRGWPLENAWAAEHGCQKFFDHSGKFVPSARRTAILQHLGEAALRGLALEREAEAK